MAINREKVLEGAMKLIAQSKFDKAIVELEKIVAEDPKDVRTLLKIAETLHVKMGKRREALDRYNRAATIYAEGGFFLKAVAVYKQMLTVDATNPDLILRLAEMYQQLGYGSQSIQHYQQVAMLYEQQGRSRDALGILKRMVDLDPEHLQPRVKVAELYAQQGMYAEAAAEMRAAYTHLRDQQRLDDAVRCGDRVVQWDPTALDVSRELATLHMQRGDARGALRNLELCFKADPRNVEVLGLIAQAFLATAQVAKAVSVYREMARIYEGAADAESARACWEKVLEYAPGDEAAETALGRRVVAPAVVAAKVNPEDEQLQRMLTETDVYVKYGLRDKAAEHLGRLLSIRPDHLAALEKMKTLQVQMKQPAAAAATLQRLLALDAAASHPKAAEWRAELERLRPGPAAPAAPPAVPTRASAPARTPPPDDDDLIDLEDKPPPPRSASSPPVAGPRSAAMLRGTAPRVAAPLREPAPPVVLAAVSGASVSGPTVSGPTVSSPTVSGPTVSGPTVSGPTVSAPPRTPPPAAPDDDDLLSDVRASPLPPDEPPPRAPALALPISNDDGVYDPEAFGASADEDQTGAVDAVDLASLEASRALSAPPPVPFTDEDDDANAPYEAGPNDPYEADEGDDDDASAGVAPQVSANEGVDFDPAELDALAAQAVRAALPAGMARPQAVNFAADEVGSFEYLPAAADDEAAASTGGDPADTDPDALARAAVAGMPPSLNEDETHFSDERTVAYDASTVMRELRLAQPAAAAPSPATAPAPGVEPAATPAPSADVWPAGDNDGADFGDPRDPTASGDGVTEKTYARGFVVPDLDSGAVLPSNTARHPPPSFEDGDAAAAAAADTFAPAATSSHPVDASVGGYAALDTDAIEELGDEDVEEAPYEAVPSVVDGGGFDVPSQARSLFQPDQGFEDDPANRFFADELAEGEFFLREDMLDEARDVLRPVIDEVPESLRLRYLLARIDARERGEPDPPAPWEQRLLQDVAEQLSELAALLPRGDVPSQPDQVSVEEVLSQFKRGVAETVAIDDAATHYDLGIAYREMGLLDDAVGEFELAARSPTRAADAHYVISLVRTEQGRTDAALAALANTLGSAHATRDQRAAAEFQRGVVLEQVGHGRDAVVAFKRSRSLGTSNADLERRLTALIAVYGDVDVEGRPA
ncbi:MAG: tetratricopeptide repeat protein [Deltaproteobacteria bacterium]|nr:tetratricopeptide repeat protein [Deltaproteobacteria bacterium]